MKDKGLKAAELSRRSEVDKAYISMLLSGKRANPSDEIVFKIASGLRVTVDYLLTGNDDCEPVNLREIELNEARLLMEDVKPYGSAKLSDTEERGIFGYTVEELLERIEALADQAAKGGETAGDNIKFMIPILRARILQFRQEAGKVSYQKKP